MDEETPLFPSRNQSHVEIRRSHLVIFLIILLLVITILLAITCVAVILESRSSVYISLLCKKLIEDC